MERGEGGGATWAGHSSWNCVAHIFDQRIFIPSVYCVWGGGGRGERGPNVIFEKIGN